MLPTEARAVFISYAHRDNESKDPKERWLDRFVEFLRPLIRQEDFTSQDRTAGIYPCIPSSGQCALEDTD